MSATIPSTTGAASSSASNRKHLLTILPREKEKKGTSSDEDVPLCGRRESNPYASRHQILSLACLPISTRPRQYFCPVLLERTANVQQFIGFTNSSIIIFINTLHVCIVFGIQSRKCLNHEDISAIHNRNRGPFNSVDMELHKDGDNQPHPDYWT